MKVRITLVTVFVFLTVVLTMAAMAASPAKPKDKLRELDVFGGKWQCKGWFLGMAGMPKHAVNATTMGEWILNNKWMAIRYAEAKTKENAMPFEVRGFITYD